MYCFNFDTRPATNIEYLLQPPTPITIPLQNTLSCPYRLFFLPATQTPSSPESQSSFLIRTRISPKNMRDSLPRPQATDHKPDHPPQATGHRPPSSYPSTYPVHGPASQPTGRYTETTGKIRTSFPSTTDPQTTLPDDSPEPQIRPHQTTPDQRPLPFVHLLGVPPCRYLPASRAQEGRQIRGASHLATPEPA